MAAKSVSRLTPVLLQCTKIPRFSEEDGGTHCVRHMEILENGSCLAVAGSKKEGGTFIDLFRLQVNPDFYGKPYLMKKSQPYHSKRYTSPGSLRCVCLLDAQRFVICGSNTIESYDIKAGGILHRGQFNGEAWCMTTAGGFIYVALDTSQVIVFDSKLIEIKTITLHGLDKGDWPWDIAVSNDKLFICTGYPYFRTLLCNGDGEIEQEYTKQQDKYAYSITVNEAKGLLFILWGGGSGTRVVVAYSLFGGHVTLSADHASGGHKLASFDIPNGCQRIRVNNNINRLFAVTETTGEIHEYNTSDIFSFDIVLASLGSLIEEKDCLKLLSYFEVPAQKDIMESDAPSSSLLQLLKESGMVSVDDIRHLLKACSDQGLSEAVELISIYQHIQYSSVTEELQATKRFQEQISVGPKESERHLRNVEEKLTKETGNETQKPIEQMNDAKMERDQIGTSLLVTNQEQLLADKQGMSQDILNQKGNASGSVEEVKCLPHDKITQGTLQEEALSAAYGKLMVQVTDELTLDSVLRLATLFNLPPAQRDMLRRISFVESPGITLLNFMKMRNIINMYDVTNLQQGLMCIQRHRINERLLIPYQAMIDPFQFEENRSPILHDWSADNATQSFTAENDSQLKQGSEVSMIQNSEEPGMKLDSKILSKEKENGASEDRADDEGNSTEKTKKEASRVRKGSPQRRPHDPYIEHNINCEGGTISIMGVHVTIPQDALSNDHVIAVNVIYDADLDLPGSALRGRMTPLIKLEPEGLQFQKPVNLKIPHSAIIPEPDRHSVIVFTGRTADGNLQKGEITWTEEKTTKWKLDQENISVDIDTLSYVFVNLVSQETEQNHIFRVVSFVDGILDDKDDVLLTVCFCKDREEDYQFLLDDHQSKLILGNYETFLISRTRNGSCDDTATYMDLTMSAHNDSYHITKEESTKNVDINHLCAASRVTRQFRLNRNQDGIIGMFDVELKVSQNEKNRVAVNLHSKVKDILLSRESQGMLYKVLTDLTGYEKLKEDVASLLDIHDCKELAVGFELRSAENDAIQEYAEPGKLLLKILDERQLIKPDKMIKLYERLKAIHLNNVARIVLEYVGASKKKTRKEDEGEIGGIRKIQEIQELKVTRNATLLMQEGYERLNVQRALKLSLGKIDLGRKLLQLAKEEHEMLSLFPGSNLYKEQYMDHQGGELDVAGVHLQVPAGALDTGRIVSLRVSTDPDIEGPFSEQKNLRLTPFVQVGPENLMLAKPVVLIIPHCAFTSGDPTGVDVYSGVLKTNISMQWRKEGEHLSCVMESHQFELEMHKACLIGLHVPYRPKMMKRICVIPIAKRVSHSEEHLIITLWFHNDNKLEHKSLINEVVYQQNAIKLCDPVSVLLKSLGSTLTVRVTSETSECTSNPRNLEVDMDTLWLRNRHKAVFRLHNKRIRDLNLEIEATYGEKKKILFQRHIELKIEKLLRIEQITSPFQRILPESIVRSFHQLTQNLPQYIDAEQSTQLSNIFQLRQSGLPGSGLLKTLTTSSLISPANVAALENALTEQGNEDCAKLVRDFRKNNQIVQETMCQRDKRLPEI